MRHRKVAGSKAQPTGKMGSSIQHQRKRARTTEGATTSLKSRIANSPAKNPVARKAEKSNINLQECSFVQWDVSGIDAVASSRCGNLIVVSRADGSIELRRKELVWAVSSVLFSTGGNPEEAVSSAVFSGCGRYVFLGRLDGILLVLRITDEGMQEYVRLDPGGGAIWDIAVSRQESDPFHIAVACDDGCVRFVRPDPTYFEIDNLDATMSPPLPTDSMHYIVKISESTKARVLSVAWAAPSARREEDCVACGDADGGVRWINPSDGSLYGRGKIPSVREENTMIWTITFARDGEDVVCGDSRGMATVWASGTNTIKQEVRIEGLTGCLWSSTIVGEATSSESILFGSAGGSIGGLQSPISSDHDDLWVPLRGCHFHSHDVRAMSCLPNGMVVTGSIDARMCIFSLADFIDRRKIQWILPYQGSAGQNPVQVNRDCNLILSRRKRGVDIWSLDRKRPDLKLRMELNSLDADVIACAISPDSTHVALSSFDAFRLYNVWNRDDTTDETELGKVRVLPLAPRVASFLEGCTDIAYCGPVLIAIAHARQEVACYIDGNLRIFSKHDLGSTAIRLEHVTCSGNKVAVADSMAQVFCASIDTDCTDSKTDVSWTIAFRGNEKETVSQICVSPSLSKLAIAMSDCSVFISDLQSEGENSWRVPGSFPCLTTSLSFSDSEDSLVISGEKFCVVACTVRSSRKRRAGDSKQSIGFEPYFLRFRDSILCSSVLGESKMVVVRRRWNLIQSSLPDAIPTKPFGT